MLSLWLHSQQDYIAQNLCKNRMEPELMCSGRCYINAQTAEAIGQHNQSEDAPISMSDWGRMLSPFVLSAPSKSTIDFHFIARMANISETFYQFQYIATIFQPPRFV